LRFRLLGPILLTACVAAVVVALVSHRLGARWAEDELRTRFDGIEETLADSSYPLNATVLDSLAKLTQTELATLNVSGSLQYSTVPFDRTLGVPSPFSTAQASGEKFRQVAVGGNRYRVRSFNTSRSGSRIDGVSTVAVLFDEKQIDASRRRAMLLPLATGISTILALTTITLVLSSRLVGRLGRLKERVEAVAEGDFDSTVSDHVADEVGQLGRAVDAMAGQLKKLWNQVNRQQSEKLLHQIAGGMAHQLRNSLTGARMAVELHAGQCKQGDDEGLEVAVHQIELSEDYVRRLLEVASGQKNVDRPQPAGQCINDIRKSLSPIARHLRIDIQWDISDAANDFPLRDGPTWTAAVTNLVHNAMQAGDRVQVTVQPIDGDQLVVRVADNGNGVPDHVAGELFEPFVTSKPEGLGLGLSVARRGAKQSGGEVRWKREGNWTIFEMTASK
jgi:signal transduction histidine kinase